jgi:hypothetical protein
MNSTALLFKVDVTCTYDEIWQGRRPAGRNRHIWEQGFWEEGIPNILRGNKHDQY